MMFIAGIVVGLLVAILVFVILVLFSIPILRTANGAVRQLRLASPANRGFITEPKSEAELTREEIIEANRREGKDTKIAELL